MRRITPSPLGPINAIHASLFPLSSIDNFRIHATRPDSAYRLYITLFTWPFAISQPALLSTCAQVNADVVERTILSISPQTTSCLYMLRRFGSVKKPSLPATSNRQSLVTAERISPACKVCWGWRPNVMHLPTRCLTSESHLGLREAVAGFMEVDCQRRKTVVDN